MLGHRPRYTLLEGKRRLITEHAACLCDREVQIQSEKFETGLIDDGRVLGAAELARPSTTLARIAPGRAAAAGSEP